MGRCDILGRQRFPPPFLENQRCPRRIASAPGDISLTETLPPFDAELWQWQAKANWFFVTVPVDLAGEVRLHAFLAPRGLGSVRVTASSGEVRWDTSLFPDKSSGSYVLPVKAQVRRALNLSEGDSFRLQLRFRDAPSI